MNDELIFKALSDEHRRKLLDLLFERDGQTASELQTHLPMTRFGAAKHLQVLEDAGLISTKKVGREKLHYLNPVPIQLVYERWVSKYAQPWSQALTALKFALEEQPMSERPTHIFQVFIRTTPERLWQAITDGAMTAQYYFGSRVESRWENGAPYAYIQPDNATLLDGEILECDPPHRLVTTFIAKWRPDAVTLPPSKVTYEITAMGNACKLTVIHEDLDNTHAMSAGIIEGWNLILSGLKTLIETGEPLIISS